MMCKLHHVTFFLNHQNII